MSTKTAVEKVRAFYEKDTAKRLPFDKHPLKEKSDHTKQLYVTMLAALLQYEHEPLREQIIFLERIEVGVGVGSTVQEIMKRAQTMDEKFAQDFYEEFVKRPLAHNFMIDALVMLNCIEMMSSKQAEFLSEIANVLNFNESFFKELTTFAKDVLIQSPKQYDSIVSKFGKINSLEMYADLSMKQKMSNWIVQGTAADISKALNSSLDVLVFEDCFFSDTLVQKVIQNKKLIVFKKCTFSDIQSSFDVVQVHSLIFEECIFESSSRVFNFILVSNVLLYKCKAENIHVKEKDFTYGGLIKSYSTLNVYILNCMFKNISSSATTYNQPYSNGTIISSPINNYYIKHNLFESCRINGDMDCKSLIWEASSRYTLPDGSSYRNLKDESTFLDDMTFEEYLLDEFNLTIEENVVADNELINNEPNNLSVINK